MVTVASAITVNNYVVNDSDSLDSGAQNAGTLQVVPDNCVTEPATGSGQMNHFEVQVSQSTINVWGSNAFTPPYNPATTRSSTLPASPTRTSGSPADLSGWRMTITTPTRGSIRRSRQCTPSPGPTSALTDRYYLATWPSTCSTATGTTPNYPCPNEPGIQRAHRRGASSSRSPFLASTTSPTPLAHS